MILAMDGGGTKTRFLLSDVQGHIAAEWRSEGCNYLQIGLEKLAKIISEGTAQLCQMAHSTPKAIQLAVLGIPAYGESQKDSREMERMVSRLLEIPHIIVNDVKLAWAGALACQPGIVVLSGTGSMAYAVDQNGRDWRAGGWGHYFGDEGSAYWLGQKCCALFSKMADGRSPKGPLYRIVWHELDLEKEDFALINLIAGQKDERKETAALARLLFRAAMQGDNQAQELFQQAGAELAATAVAIVKQISGQFLQAIPVSYAGGSFASGELLLSPLRSELERSRLPITFREPVLDSVLGAAPLWSQNTRLEVGILSGNPSSIPNK